MKKLIILFILVIVGITSSAQTFAPPRSNSSVTVQDSRWRALLNMYAPHIHGFNPVNGFGLNSGLDTLGGIVYDDSSRHLWYRDTVISGGHTWRQILSFSDSLTYATKFSVDTMRNGVYGQLATKVGLNAISGTSPISFNQSTGVISCPTCNTSGSVDSAVNPGLWITQSISGTTKVFNADSAAMGNFFIRKRDSGTTYVTPSQIGNKQNAISSSNQQVIFNNSGTLGGVGQFLYNTSSNTLSIGSSLGTSNGNLLIGGTSGGISTFSSGGGQLTISGTPLILSSVGNSLIFQTNSSNRANIDNSGNFSINSLAGTGTRLVTSNFSGLLGNFSNSANTIVGYDNSGNLVNMTAGTGISISGGIISNTGGGGSGNTNSNVGTGYRWAIPNTNNIKTVFGSTSAGIGWDSSANANALTITQQAAGTSQNGYLLSTDWNTFNGKLSNITGLVTFSGSNGSLTGSGTLGTPYVISVNDRLDTLWRTPGVDSIKFTIGGRLHEILDSTGSSGGTVSSVSNSDGTLNITPTTGAVVASLALAHGNTWVTNPQTFNGGIIMGNNISFSANNTYQIGTLTNAASHVFSRVFNSDAAATLASASGFSSSLSVGASVGITLISTGQVQLNNYTTATSFPGTPLAFLQSDVSGNVIQAPVSSIQTSLSNTPSGGFPLFNLNASAIRELFAGTNVTIDTVTHVGGVTINSSGTGTVLLPFYRVTDYGVTMSMSGTGTDISPYVQACVDSAFSHGGGTVWIPPGVWAWSSLDMTGMPNVSIMGAGINNTILSEIVVGDTMIKWNNNTFITIPGTNVGNAPGYGYAPISAMLLEGHNKASIGMNLQYIYWFKWNDIAIDSCTSIGLNLKGTLTGQFNNMLIKWCPIAVNADTINRSPGGFVAPNLITFVHCHIYNCASWAFNVNQTQGGIIIEGGDISDEGTTHNTNTGGVHFTNPNTVGVSMLTMRGTWFEHNVGSLIRIESTLANQQVTLENLNISNTLTPSYGLYVNAAFPLQVNVIGTNFTGDSVDLSANSNVTLNEMGPGPAFATSTVAAATRYYYEHNYGTAYSVAWPKGASGAAFVFSTGTGLGTGGTVTLSGFSTSLGGDITIATGTSPAASATIMVYGFDIAWSTVGIAPVITPANTAAKQLAGDAMPLATYTGSFNYPLITSGTIPLDPSTTYVFHLSINGK